MLEAALLLTIGVFYFWDQYQRRTEMTVSKEGYIKWVDFNVSYEALCRAYEYDVDSYGKEIHLNWIELLAYTACVNGGEFGSGAVSDMKEIAEELLAGETTMEKATKDMEYYEYYYEAYTAVLDGYVGEYEIQESGSETYVKKYGLKVFSPIAKDFPYSDYDDFGVSRSFGYKREHLGHDMMGQIGTPIRIINYIRKRLRRWPWYFLWLSFLYWGRKRNIYAL